MSSIHRIVLRRLILAWLSVSFVVGGVSYYIETEKIDDAIVALAASESTNFTLEGLDPGEHKTGQLEALQQKAREFVKRNFVVIEIYDQNEHRLLEVINPDYEDIESALKKIKHTFPHNARSRYQKYAVGNTTVVQVLVPLPNKLGGNAGFFEGVFIVPQSTIDDFERQLWRTLATLLFAVLATTVVLYPVIISLNKDVTHFSHEVMKGNLEMASVLGAAISKRDSNTGDHNFRVTLYAISLGEAVKLPPIKMRNLILGAFLHDVGKIGVSDNILLKPSKLTAEEFAIIRTHVTLGVDIINQSTWLDGAREVIEGHHEKYDGSGYLRGLKGEAIPLNARIFAIVDVFDALTSRRPYKAAMPLEEAISILKSDTGSHFDPALIAHFISLAPALYESIGDANEKKLLEMLKNRAMHYFLEASIQKNAA